MQTLLAASLVAVFSCTEMLRFHSYYAISLSALGMLTHSLCPVFALKDKCWQSAHACIACMHPSIQPPLVISNHITKWPPSGFNGEVWFICRPWWWLKVLSSHKQSPQLCFQGCSHHQYQMKLSFNASIWPRERDKNLISKCLQDFPACYVLLTLRLKKKSQ